MTTTFVVDDFGRVTIEKAPGEVLDYTFDWVDYLAPTVDTIASQQVAVAGVTLDSSSFTGTKQTAWIRVGTLKTTATVDFKIITIGARTAVRRLYIKIKNR